MQQQLAGFSSTALSDAAGEASHLAAEAALEQRCKDAFAAVKAFENTHNLSVQSMGYSYTAARAGLVARLLEAGTSLGLSSEPAHDAVLLMDRALSASFKVRRRPLWLAADVCM